jgi:RNA polymerase sigma-70 factor (ECF subfamily)
LPEKYAIPLKMADIEGLKQQEIANKLGLSLTGAKSRIQRARKLLKEEIHTCFHTKECSSAGLTDFSLRQDCTPLKNLKEENK